MHQQVDNLPEEITKATRAIRQERDRAVHEERRASVRVQERCQVRARKYDILPICFYVNGLHRSNPRYPLK